MAPQEKGSYLKKEIAGIVFLALALFCVISLVSRKEASNWGGVVGEYLSHILFFTMGYTAYIFPLVLLVLALEFLVRRNIGFRTTIPVSLVLFVFSTSGLLSQLMESKDSGGIIGIVSSTVLNNYLGTTGAFIVLGTVFVIATVLSTGLSLVDGMRGLFSILRTMLRGVWRLLERLGRSKEKIKETVTEKTEKIYNKVVDTGPAIIEPSTQRKKKVDIPSEPLDLVSPGGFFRLPSTSLLDPAPERDGSIDRDTLLENSRILERKLRDFGVEGRVVEVRPGPVVTLYEFEPAPGIKVGRITALSSDLALAMRAMSVRVIAPIPGKSVVGIEIPNLKKEPILFRELAEYHSFVKSRSPLTLILGKDISGNPFITDLARMPHLLVAGATGTGKSVSVNAMILSILFKSTPEDVRFLMIDPKMLELSPYEDIPHLITPVVTDPKKATGVLKSIVLEMEKRYRLMAEKGAKNIERYNQIIEKNRKKEEGEHKHLPYIVVVVDELADLMLIAGKEVEESLMRLSQMARAAGIHLIVATQRPSVDVITGVIKTNFPARIALQVPSRTDSRTILDATGAETLLGEGDMLFLPPGTSRLKRVHGVYVSEGEIKRVTEFLKKQSAPSYDEEIMEPKEEDYLLDDEEMDEGFLKRYQDAVELAQQMDMISTSFIQRRFRIGYNTAARIIEKMEKDGIVGPSQGSRPREVLKKAKR